MLCVGSHCGRRDQLAAHFAGVEQDLAPRLHAPRPAALQLHRDPHLVLEYSFSFGVAIPQTTFSPSYLTVQGDSPFEGCEKGFGTYWG